MSALPVDGLIPDILSALQRGPNLVLEAPPGAGKTTRVPPALLTLGLGEVWVLEPRRLAARLAARRVASEFGEAVGETVGYQVRFEEVAGPRTRLRFVTEGVLTRRLLSDPALRGVGAVVLDEFHERHLEGDLALALLRRLQVTSRPELRLVVMSATLDAAPVARHLGECPVVRSEGRLFPLDVRYTPHSTRTLEEQVAQALEQWAGEGREGDALVFLPGAAEIRRAARACAGIAQRSGWELVPLHGDLSPAEQDRAVAPGAQRKVILSTNVAESSVTIEGVRAVIDSGLARVASDSPWTGLSRLEVTRVAKASAVQRAGRAARTAAGWCTRLYTEEDFARRPEQLPPEVARRELSQVCLELAAMGVADPRELPWLEAPPHEAVEAAQKLLRDLGATGERARRMASMPVHPRLARLVLEAEARGAGDDGCAAAAVLSAGERLPARPRTSAASDLFVLMDGEWQPQTRRLYEQLRRSVRRGGHHESALQMAVLAAFPDRVARRRSGRELLLAGGGSAVLEESSVVGEAEFLVAIDVEERRERGLPLVRLANAIEPDWLLDLFPERVTERSGVEWNRTAQRVEAVSAMLFDGLVIDESRGARPDPEEAARMLAAKALEAGIERFVDADELRLFLERVRFASSLDPSIPVVGSEEVEASLGALATGSRSFAELREAAQDGGLVRVLESRVPMRRVEQLAPARIRLPGGRQTPVHYESGKPPWIASRLQDFFGMKETPRVGEGRVPVVVHLLAPNQRPVQTTTDLAGFWERLYPQVRRELSRRYPKHKWPEDPRAV